MAKSNIRITKRVVVEPKAGDKERFVWGNQLIGFGVRVSPKGPIVSSINFLEGRTRRFRIGIHGAPWTPETARQEVTRLRLRAGRHGAPSRQPTSGARLEQEGKAAKLLAFGA